MLTVTSTCQGTTDSMQNIIKSPNYPQKYPNHALCKWSIRSPPNTQIEINLEEFATEKRHDKLEIFDGHDSTASKIRTLSGDLHEQSVGEYRLYIESSRNELFLKFTSDTSYNRKGFLIHYALRQGKHEIRIL